MLGAKTVGDEPKNLRLGGVRSPEPGTRDRRGRRRQLGLGLRRELT